MKTINKVKTEQKQRLKNINYFLPLLLASVVFYFKVVKQFQDNQYIKASVYFVFVCVFISLIVIIYNIIKLSQLNYLLTKLRVLDDELIRSFYFNKNEQFRALVTKVILNSYICPQSVWISGQMRSGKWVLANLIKSLGKKVTILNEEPAETNFDLNETIKVLKIKNESVIFVSQTYNSNLKQTSIIPETIFRHFPNLIIINLPTIPLDYYKEKILL